jgi:hypothetical protein
MMHVENSMVSRDFLTHYAAQLNGLITDDIVSSSSSYGPQWLLGFIADVLQRNSGDMIPLKGGQVQVVERMGDLPVDWAHWNDLLVLKGICQELILKNEKASRHCSLLMECAKPSLSKNLLLSLSNAAGQCEIYFEKDSNEFMMANVVLNYLNTLSSFYWGQKYGTKRRLDSIYGRMLELSKISKEDVDFIFSNAKGRIAAWNLANQEIFPGALVKVKNLKNAIGIAQTGVTYDASRTTPYFLAIVNGQIVEVTVDQYSPAQRRKKEKSNA